MTYVSCPNCGTTLTSGLGADPPSTCPDCCSRLTLDAALMGPPRPPADEAPSFEGTVANDPAAPAAARRALELFCAGMDRDVTSNCALMLSEVVTNAVRHGCANGGSTIALHFATAGGMLQIEVSDDGPGFTPAEPEPSLDAENGWGLQIVGALAESWGVDDGRPTRVWFDLPLEPSAVPVPN